MTESDVAMGTVVADRYVVGRLLGSGSMGTVRAAFDLDLEREVAIKFVSVETLAQAEAIDRFRREVDVVTRIRSEHVVRVLDVGTLPDGVPFMVMELLVGRSLDEERELRGVIPLHEAVSYVLPAIEVLAEAHASGVVHRDIKPANLFLEERKTGGRRVKVLDFGVSKSDLAAPESLVTEVGTITGSPLYMAPEQLRSSASADARADIWSLGAILFELVSGRTAHEGETVAEVCEALLRDPPHRITDFASELPLAFVEVVTRCLEPDRDRRYSNVAELGAALLPFAPGGAAHVERARRALAPSAPGAVESRERVPASDAPFTVAVRDSRGPVESAARALPVPPAGDDESYDFGKLRTVRMAIAFTFVGLGVGTAFLLEFPELTRRGSAAASAAETLDTATGPARAPSADAASGMTVRPLSPAPSVATPAVAPVAAIAPSADAKRSAFSPRAPVRKWTPKRKTGVARPSPASGVEVTDFGGRR